MAKVKMEKALRTRRCNIEQCKNSIQPKENHVRIYSGSQYPINMCMKCFTDFIGVKDLEVSIDGNNISFE